MCFVNAIEEVADQAGEDLESLLPRLEVIRYSTTVAMNRLIERRGPRVGLITTEGHEDAILIGRGAQWTDGTRLAERRNLARQRKPTPLIPRTMIVGVKERIDSTGRVVRPLDEDDLRRKLRVLMDRGMLNTTHGHVAVGWLIVEDIFTVLALVLVPMLGGTGSDAAAGPGELAGPGSGGGTLATIAWAVLKLAALVAIVLIGGSRIVPWILTRVARLRSAAIRPPSSDKQVAPRRRRQQRRPVGWRLQQSDLAALGG